MPQNVEVVPGGLNPQQGLTPAELEAHAKRLRAISGLPQLQNDPRAPNQPAFPPIPENIFRADRLAPSTNPNAPQQPVPEMGSKEIVDAIERIRVSLRAPTASWDTTIMSGIVNWYMRRERISNSNVLPAAEIEMRFAANLQMSNWMAYQSLIQDFLGTFEAYNRFLSANRDAGALRGPNPGNGNIDLFAMERRMIASSDDLTALMPYWSRVLQLVYLQDILDYNRTNLRILLAPIALPGNLRQQFLDAADAAHTPQARKAAIAMLPAAVPDDVRKEAALMLERVLPADVRKEIQDMLPTMRTRLQSDRDRVRLHLQVRFLEELPANRRTDAISKLIQELRDKIRSGQPIVAADFARIPEALRKEMETRFRDGRAAPGALNANNRPADPDRDLYQAMAGDLPLDNRTGLFDSVRPVMGHIFDVVGTANETVTGRGLPPTFAQRVANNLPLLNDEQRKNLVERLQPAAGGPMNIECRRAHALYLNLLLRHRNAQIEQILKQQTDQGRPINADDLNRIFTLHHQIGQSIMREHAYGIQLNMNHLWIGTLQVDQMPGANPGDRPRAFHPNILKRLQELSQMPVNDPGQQANIDSLRKTSVDMMERYINSIMSEGLVMHQHVTIIDQGLLHPAAQALEGMLQDWAAMFEEASELPANVFWFWGAIPFIAPDIMNLRLPSGVEARRKMLAEIRGRIEADLDRVRSLRETINTGQANLERIRKRMMPHFDAIRKLSTQDLANPNVIKQAREHVEAIAKLDEELTTEVNRIWSQIEANVIHHGNAMTANAIMEGSIWRAILNLTIGLVGYACWRRGGDALAARIPFGIGHVLNFRLLPTRTWMGLVDFFYEPLSHARMPIFGSYTHAEILEGVNRITAAPRSYMNPFGNAVTPYRNAMAELSSWEYYANRITDLVQRRELLDLIAQRRLIIFTDACNRIPGIIMPNQLDNALGMFSYRMMLFEELEREFALLASKITPAELTQLENVLNSSRRSLVSQMVLNVRAPTVPGTPAWNPVFNELGQIESRILKMAPSAERGRLLRAVNTQRLSLIRTMTNLNTTVIITPAQWDAVKIVLRQMLAAPGLREETRQLINVLLGRAGPPGSLGELLLDVHQLGCRETAVLRAGLLNILREAGITDASIRGLLVDTGSLGTRPPAPAIPAAPPRPLGAAAAPEAMQALRTHPLYSRLHANVQRALTTLETSENAGRLSRSMTAINQSPRAVELLNALQNNPAQLQRVTRLLASPALADFPIATLDANATQRLINLLAEGTIPELRGFIALPQEARIAVLAMERTSMMRVLVVASESAILRVLVQSPEFATTLRALTAVEAEYFLLRVANMGIEDTAAFVRQFARFTTASERLTFFRGVAQQGRNAQALEGFGRFGGRVLNFAAVAFEGYMLYEHISTLNEQQNSIQSLTKNLRAILPEDLFSYDRNATEFVHRATQTRISVANIDQLARRFLGVDYAQVYTSAIAVLAALSLFTPLAPAGIAILIITMPVRWALSDSETTQWVRLYNDLPPPLLAFFPTWMLRTEASSNYRVWQRMVESRVSALGVARLERPRPSPLDIEISNERFAWATRCEEAERRALFHCVYREICNEVPVNLLTSHEANRRDPISAVWADMETIERILYLNLPGVQRATPNIGVQLGANANHITAAAFNTAVRRTAQHYARVVLEREYRRYQDICDDHAARREQMIESLRKMGYVGGPALNVDALILIVPLSRTLSQLPETGYIATGWRWIAGIDGGSLLQAPRTRGIVEACELLDPDTELIPLLEVFGRMPTTGLTTRFIWGLEGLPSAQDRAAVLRAFLGRGLELDALTVRRAAIMNICSLDSGAASIEELLNRMTMIGSRAPGGMQYTIADCVHMGGSRFELSVDNARLNSSVSAYDTAPERRWPDIDIMGGMILRNFVDAHNRDRRNHLDSPLLELTVVRTRVTTHPHRREVAADGRTGTQCYMLRSGGYEVFFREEGGRWEWSSAASYSWQSVERGRYSEAQVKTTPIYGVFNAAAVALHGRVNSLSYTPNERAQRNWQEARTLLFESRAYNPVTVMIAPGIPGVQFTDGTSTARFYSLGGWLRWDSPPNNQEPAFVADSRWGASASRFQRDMNHIADRLTLIDGGSAVPAATERIRLVERWQQQIRVMLLAEREFNPTAVTVPPGIDAVQFTDGSRTVRFYMLDGALKWDTPTSSSPSGVAYGRWAGDRTPFQHAMNTLADRLTVFETGPTVNNDTLRRINIEQGGHQILTAMGSTPSSIGEYPLSMVHSANPSSANVYYVAFRDGVWQIRYVHGGPWSPIMTRNGPVFLQRAEYARYTSSSINNINEILATLAALQSNATRTDAVTIPLPPANHRNNALVLGQQYHASPAEYPLLSNMLLRSALEGENFILRLGTREFPQNGGGLFGPQPPNVPFGMANNPPGGPLFPNMPGMPNQPAQPLPQVERFSATSPSFSVNTVTENGIRTIRVSLGTSTVAWERQNGFNFGQQGIGGPPWTERSRTSDIPSVDYACIGGVWMWRTTGVREWTRVNVSRYGPVIRTSPRAVFDSIAEQLTTLNQNPTTSLRPHVIRYNLPVLGGGFTLADAQFEPARVGDPDFMQDWMRRQPPPQPQLPDF